MTDKICGGCFWFQYCRSAFSGLPEDSNCIYTPSSFLKSDGFFAEPISDFLIIAGVWSSKVSRAVPEIPDGNAFERAQRWLIVDALIQKKWVQQDAARLLGITPRMMHYHIAKFGLWHPSWHRPEPEIDETEELT